MSADCSIIIPVYNAEATIIDTLESIELDKQWKYRVEVVVIDDGSRDNTPEILFEYVKSHPDVIVVTQENSGVSSARNNGIAKASGKYLFFIDSDDKLHRDVLDKMIGVDEEQGVDLVISDYYHYYISEDKRETISCKLPCATILDNEYFPTIFRRYFVGDNTGLSNLWNKLFRADIIKMNSLSFDDNRTHGEDWAFCINYFQVIDSAYAIDEPVYEYRLDGTQDRSKYRKTLAYCLIDGYRIVEGLNERYLRFDVDSYEYMIHMRSFYYQIIGFINMDCTDREKKSFLKEKEVKKCFKYIKRLSDVQLIKLDLSRRDRLCSILLSLGRYKIAVKMFDSQ